MEMIQKKIFQSEQFQRLKTHMEQLTAGCSITLESVSGSLLAFVTSLVFTERQVLLIASDEERAEKLRDDCAMLAGEENVRYFGSRPPHQMPTLDISSSITQLETLKALTTGNRFIIVASPNSIVEKIPPPARFSKTIIEIEVNRDQGFTKLIEQLEAIKFDRKNFVETYGDFAVRGGIIDVFPYVGENPIRLEFWGDTVESIREFDVLSQRSIRELTTACIVPSLTADESELTGLNAVSLFDYLRQGAVVLLDGPEIVKREIDEIFREGTTNLFTSEEILNRARQFPLIITSMVRNIGSPAGIDFHSVSQPAFNGSIRQLVEHLETITRDGYTIYLTSDTKEEAGRLKELIEDAEERTDGDSGSSIHDLPWPDDFNAYRSTRTSSLQPNYLSETPHAGFLYHPAKLAVFTEHEIFGRLKRRGLLKRRRFKGISQKELQQLKRGDYVVHVDHGIGEFAGLAKIHVGGVEQEVMKVLFLEKDTLYVNLNFINRIQKYSSQEGHAPKLTKLGAPDWERMKAKAKRRIKDIARELIALYARRKKEQGTAFSPDSLWQKELEASFMYEDTEDQATATLDVKHDMESSSPMDRLICGDVGFGKTEVALRAAFKAVMEGKQVAVLVPTTILAIQHYNTFMDRLSRYTTRVENLTRFKSKKDQQRIIDEMKKGSIDIVIGTHRLLSKDIGFKDLGLLIIDEEHRFGVSAKEKLRQLKANVDTLALTATPIPRTLHFSLIGARDLSLINTPPRNRLPILTEIISGSGGRQTQWEIIREVILKEAHRGGQIYFVHDRVQNIGAVAAQVKEHVPEVRVHLAHGQMTGHELEKTMLDFLEKKFDVLVCTKIIESGLDIPNVNTIIINRADRFGLAELYQLRGRVGRSNVQAYAYLLVPPLTVLPKQTIRRLTAIEEFTELGSGFHLAMRDLEIRGAGNLLGAEQSGFIMEMGFEMYERIVREAVDELKQEEFKELLVEGRSKMEVGGQQRTVETIIDADIEALIPDFYVESDAERLDIYRRLYRAASEDELSSMRAELTDRFGEYPDEVENLIQLVEVRLLASRAGFPKISIKARMLAVTLPDESDKHFYGEPGEDHSPFQRLIKKIALEKVNKIQLKQAGKELTLQITLPVSGEILQQLNNVKERLSEVIERNN